MEKRRHPVLWVVTTSFFLAAVVLFVLFRFVLKLPAKADTSADPMYTIGEWKGYVAVFEGEQTYPKQVTDMPISGLPPEMQQRVREGVFAYSDAELSVMLEDYTG